MTSSETGSVWVRGKLVLSRIAGLHCMCLFQLAESFIEGIIVAKRKHNKYARILYDLSYMAKVRAIVMAVMHQLKVHRPLRRNPTFRNKHSDYERP